MINKQHSTLNQWQQVMQGWHFAYDLPSVIGNIKQQPQDFVVDEKMLVQPSGEGEHVWLHVTKVKQNTEQVAKALARFAKVAYRDVGYSGMKDFFAVTHQWFSVWLPTHKDKLDHTLEWDVFDMPGVTINQVTRHTKKIKRGTHQANHFTITVRGLNADTTTLLERLQTIRDKGVPNYFGSQRFGKQASNLETATALFNGSRKIKQRQIRSLALSAARSWLFNQVLSARIANQTWQNLYPHEPANLNGSGSSFDSSKESDGKHDKSIEQRLHALDIHPTGPMWGQSNHPHSYTELAQFEYSVMQTNSEFMSGLENARLDYQRRPLRMSLADLTWQLESDQLTLKFSLQRGQFATAVLREIVCQNDIATPYNG